MKIGFLKKPLGKKMKMTEEDIKRVFEQAYSYIEEKKGAYDTKTRRTMRVTWGIIGFVAGCAVTYLATMTM